MKKIIVAAAALMKDGKIFIAQRPASKLPPLVWEFPGGKPESGETLQQALRRELQEELHIDTIVGDFVMQTTHQYDFAEIELNLFKVTMVDPNAAIRDEEHHATAWVNLSELDKYDFAAADKAIVAYLQKNGL